MAAIIQLALNAWQTRMHSNRSRQAHRIRSGIHHCPHKVFTRRLRMSPSEWLAHKETGLTLQRAAFAQHRLHDAEAPVRQVIKWRHADDLAKAAAKRARDIPAGWASSSSDQGASGCLCIASIAWRRRSSAKHGAVCRKGIEIGYCSRRSNRPFRSMLALQLTKRERPCVRN
jgi:hypothetical protein